MTADKRKGTQAVPTGPEVCIDHREALIDEALKESFPASDPPSIARPVCVDDVESGER